MNEDIQIKALPKEERPRERLMRFGVEKSSNAELLAILIGSGSDEGSALTLAKRLMALDQTGVKYLAECAPEELSQLRGIGIAKACRITAAIELGKRLASKSKERRPTVKNAADVSRLLMEDMRYLKKEYFKAVLLNVKSEILSVDQVAVGGLNSAKIHPREVFTNAVKKSAAGMILVHNHPSGDAKPSQSDIELTARLKKAGNILGIDVYDHVIIGDGVFTSMREGFFM